MEEKIWWKEEIAYQIYPQSFKDSNNDGIGDINGIISKLEYLKNLGITLIWICPIYSSPMDDNGYDISDYYNINPNYGTLKDVENLLEQSKKYNIKIIFDLVLNHTSDEHTWFKNAIKNPNSKYRNYYYFKEGKNHKPPNNWRSAFGGSAWEEIENTNIFYLHLFSKKQPDLNWENSEMRNDLYKMINWWLKKGLSGFRIDAINNIKKNLNFPDGIPDGEDGLCQFTKFCTDQPGLEIFFQDLKKNTFEKFNCMTVCESWNVPYEHLNKYIGKNGGFSMMFDFNYINIDTENGIWCKKRNWNFDELINDIHNSQLQIQKIGWSAPFWENHDFPRSLNKYLNGRSYEKATLLAGIFIFLRGTPFIYQGEEIGMINCERKNINDFDDICTKGQFLHAKKEGYSDEEALKICNEKSRDNARVPMAWNDKKYGGFSENEPWIKMDENYKIINVEKEMREKKSIFNFYKEIIQLRKKYVDIFVYGRYEKIDCENDVIGYKRVNGEECMVVFGNFSNEERGYSIKPTKNVICSNNEVKEKLLPYQFILFKE